MNDYKAILCAIAEAEVGTREQGGNNRGGRIVAYQAATWLAPDAWPWCAAFVCWCIKEWLKVPGVPESLGVSNVERWRPKTAGAFDFLRWAREKDLPILGENAEVQAGDLVIFDFSHIGIVVDDAAKGSQFVQTVEGNTNGRGDRESTSGDGVWMKKRARGLARNFIRIT
jgi:hypothetical protein